MADHAYLLHEEEQNHAGHAQPVRQPWFRSTLGKTIIAVVTLSCVAAVVAAVVVSTRSHSSSGSGSGSSSQSSSASFAEVPAYHSLRTVMPNMPEATLSPGSAAHLTRAQLTFTHSDPATNTHTTLNYDVEHENVINLIRLGTVKDVTQKRSLLTIVFKTASDAAALKSELTVGRGVIIASEYSSGAMNVRINSPCKTVEPASLSCQFEVQKPTAFFKSAKVTFSTNANEANKVPTLVYPPRRSSKSHRHGRRSIGSFLSGALGDIWNSIGGVGGVVEDLVTGSFSYANNNLLASQWNIPLVSGNIDGIMQYSSSATISTSSNLQIEIQNYELVQFTATVTGSGVVNAAASLTANYQGSWTDGPNEVVQPTTLLSTNLPIAGIDIPIALVGNVYMAAQAQTTDSATGNVAYQATGSFTGGITVDSNGPQWVATPNFQYGLNGNPSLQADASFQGSIQVTPVLVLNVGSLGNAQAMVPLQFNGNVNANAALDNPSSSQCPDGTSAFDCQLQIQLQANVNIQVDGISVYNQNWGPSTEFSQDYPFADECF